MELAGIIIEAFLKFCFGSAANRNNSIVGESPMERQEARFWRVVGWGVVIGTIAVIAWLR